MSIYLGKCKTCGNGEDNLGGNAGIHIFDDDDQCLTCKRLDKIEKLLKDIQEGGVR